MKRIISLLLVSVFSFTMIMAQATDSTQTESTGVVQITEWEDVPDDPSAPRTVSEDRDFFNFDSDIFKSGMDIAVIAIVFTFGFPLVVIFIAFYFQYKNRKAKYKLAEQALAAGQPIPEEFMKGATENLRSKGIKNIFTGLGIFILLWAITDFTIGCVGLLIMCIGIGEVVVAYTNKKDKKD